MAKDSINNAGLYLAEYELSSALNSIEVNGDNELHEISTFGDSNRTHQRGLIGARFAAAGVFDPTVADAPAFAEVMESAVIDKAITAVKDNQAGGFAVLMRGCGGQWGMGAPFNRPGIVTLAGQTTTSPGAVRGAALHRAAAAAVSGSGAAWQRGAVGASQKIYGALHVFAVAGSTPTLDVVIESDNGSGFSTPTTRLAFAQATQRASEWVEAGPGAITDDWWRATFTIGGSGPSFGFLVAFGFV